MSARDFHRSLPGYAPTPVHSLPQVADELGLGAVLVKDESNRLGLPSFKVLGASWAVERALAGDPGVHTLVAASAGNHGRAVAHVARMRGLRARIFLPERSAQGRRDAIAGEGAEVVVVDGDYEDAVALAAADGAQPGHLELADVGEGGPAEWVIEGYATLFEEAAEQAEFDTIIVPVGVGSLAAAAVRFTIPTPDIRVIGVEPATAACLTEALAAGEPVLVPTPGTSMAGLDCAIVSPAAWEWLRCGIDETITVTDEEVHAAMRELAAAGLAIGDSGAAPLAALPHAIVAPGSRVLLVATEGVTDPAGYAAVIG